jgi:23S rRNA pseudouridine1911/1915/1917 synthase
VSLDVLYEDNHVIAVAKPACVPVVPDESGDESLLDRARAWVEEHYAKPGRAWLGVVHRLDRPVSGVVLFARTSKAASRLAQAFARRETRKAYLAVGIGAVTGEQGRLEQWLWKDAERNRVHVRGAEAPGAKRAVTDWHVLLRHGERVLFELRPETGRPHQLRVACAALGAPLAGDLKYGAREPLADRSIALHAAQLEVIHPVRRTPLVVSAPPPAAGAAGDVWRFPAESGGTG